MLIVYAVEWVESEFGKRPEGYKIFTDRDHCVRQSLEDRKKGNYPEGGYCGPEIPLTYYEVPWDVLEDSTKDKLLSQEGDRRVTFSGTRWTPSHKSNPIRISDTEAS